MQQLMQYLILVPLNYWCKEPFIAVRQEVQMEERHVVQEIISSLMKILNVKDKYSDAIDASKASYGH